MSKYCLQHSPVPVIVVRPSSKRDKKKAKRKADPGRRVYQDILQQSIPMMTHGNNSISGDSGSTDAANSSVTSLGVDQSRPSALSGENSPKTVPASTTAGADSPSPANLAPAEDAPTENPLKDVSGVELNVSPVGILSNDREKLQSV